MTGTFPRRFSGTRPHRLSYKRIPVSRPTDSDLRVSPEEAHDAWVSLGKNNGVGRDLLPAEVFVAAGPELAPLASQMVAS